MKQVAVLENGVVVNVVLVSDDHVLSDNEVEYQDSNPASIGGDYVDGFFYQEKPFASWTRDGSGNWISPIPYPDEPVWDETAGGWDGHYVWNEEKQKWDVFVTPVTESETPDGDL